MTNRFPGNLSTLGFVYKRKSRKGWKSVLLTLLGGFLILYAPTGSATDRVTLQLRWDHQFQFAGYYAALWQGYYQEAGLEVELRSAVEPDGTLLSAIQEVIEGRADFGIGATDILLARDRGAPLVLLATLFQHSAAEFYARPSTIESFPADLTGLRVVRRVGDLIDMEFQALLAAEGIDPASIKAYPLDIRRGYLQLLAEGKVDLISGYSIGTPYEAKRIGLDIVRFKPADFGLQFYGDSLFTHRRVIDRDPHLVERFTAASLRGWQYALEHPREIAERIISEFQPAFPIADYPGFIRFQIGEVRKLTLFPVVAPGHINPYRWRHMHDLLKNTGLITGELDLNSFIFDPERAAQQRNRRLVNILGYSLGFVVLVSVAFFIWSWTLRRTVASRTAALRASERTLRKNEECLRAIADYTYDWESWLSPTGKLLWVNPGVERQTGYSVKECLTMEDYPLCIVHPADRDHMARHFQEVIAGGSANDIEFKIQRKDGRSGWAAASWQPVYDDHHQSLGSRVSIRDITERKQVAQEIQRIRSYLQHILDAMPSILVGVDLDGRVIEWSQGAEHHTGISSSQARGRLISNLFPQFHILLDKVSEVIEQSRPLPTDRLTIEQDGEFEHFDVVVYPLLLEAKPVGAVIRIDDVTDRVRFEQMLVYSEKMLSIGGLAAGMAHELNNPLGIVVQGSQLISQRLSPDSMGNQRMAEESGANLKQIHAYLERSRVLKFLDNIGEAARRASYIVKTMMAFSDRRSADFTEAPLSDMLDTAIRFADDDYDLKEHYDFEKVHIVRNYDPRLGFVKCNRTALEQVFLNLIKNAAQAMGDVKNSSCSPRLILRIYQDEDWACVEIADNGPGMEAEVRHHLFEPFFTTKPPGIGTGLGLSVAYFIVTEQHKGTLSVSSTPGKGTCFTVRLPLNQPMQALARKAG